MRSCLADAHLASESVDYINLHGTATRANDECEATAVAEVFGSRGERLPSQFDEIDAAVIRSARAGLSNL